MKGVMLFYGIINHFFKLFFFKEMFFSRNVLSLQKENKL